MRSTPISPSSISPTSISNLRSAANRLMENANRLINYVHSPFDEGRKGVEEFVENYEKFHKIASELTQRQKSAEIKQILFEKINEAKDGAITLLEQLRIAQADPNNSSLTQALSTSIQQFTLTIWTILEHIESEGSAWLRECDNALQQIQSVRHLFEGNMATMLPLNANSYYESLSEVTNEARNLGDGIKINCF